MNQWWDSHHFNGNGFASEIANHIKILYTYVFRNKERGERYVGPRLPRKRRRTRTTRKPTNVGTKRKPPTTAA